MFLGKGKYGIQKGQDVISVGTLSAEGDNFVSTITAKYTYSRAALEQEKANQENAITMENAKISPNATIVSAAQAIVNEINAILA